MNRKAIDDELKAKLHSILKQINNLSSSIEASAVTTTDGIVLASELGNGIEPDRFGAMCATLLALSKRAVKETSCGELKLVLVQGSEGAMLVVQIGHKGVLALSTNPKANLGMIFFEAKKTAAKISDLL